MPLSKRQFELGITSEVEDLMRQAYYILAGTRSLAYSEDELRESLLGAKVVISPKTSEPPEKLLRRALDVLEEVGAIESRVVGGTKYFAFLREIDTRTWEGRGRR